MRFGESALQSATGQDETTMHRILLGEKASVNVDSFGQTCCFDDEGRAEALDIVLAKAASLDRNQHYHLLT